jgi:hypothetical protein
MPTTTNPTRTTRARRRRRLLLPGVALALGGVLAAAALDIAAIDPTRGGYEPPYTDYTGEPIDWDATETTTTGMVARGRVLDTHTDCTSGMIRIEIFRLVTVDYRELSPRAVAIHDPHTSCRNRGFDPTF